MVNRFRSWVIGLWTCTVLVGSGCAFLPDREVQVPWMTQEELRGKLANAEIVVLDVRKKPDWDRGGTKIRGAFHEDYERVEEWAGKYPRDKTLVLYCA
jgi:hypothetical protein